MMDSKFVTFSMICFLLSTENEDVNFRIELLNYENKGAGADKLSPSNLKIVGMSCFDYFL